MDELRSWLILARAPGLTAGAFSSLLAHFGSLDAITKSKAAQLAAAGLNAAQAQAIAERDEAQIDRDLRWLENAEHRFIRCIDANYPRLLAELSSAPLGLFVRGKVASLALPQLAIVGSRNPTKAGRETADSFAAHLARCGLAITSGLAVGIDAASHEGALRAEGVTVAVCATGLDVVYPRAHEKLAAKIIERGALVSEFPPETPLHKFHFPRRNRIISALSLGTLVVEAALHSGSLITARYAAEQGREVFAIPGSIHNPMARGCHRLLREGAKLVESAEDILTELGPLAAVARLGTAPELTSQKSQDADGPLDKDYEILLDALGFDPAGVDQLVERSGLKADAVASMLLILELEGRVEALPGARYARVSE